MRNTSAMLAMTLLLCATTAQADNVIGFNCIVVPANTDSFVSLPLAREADAEVTVNTTTGTGLTVDEALTIAKYDNGLYYLRITSGDGEGRWSTITSNTANGLELEDASILTGVVNGDEARIVPHHTLASTFPDELEGSAFLASPPIGARKTEVLTISTSPGTNKSADKIYFFRNNQWLQAGAAGNKDDVILPPQAHFIIRNNNAETLTLYVQGTAETTQQVTELPVNTVTTDVHVSTGAAVPRTLRQLNLGGTPAFATTPPIGARADELLLFSDGPGKNKSADAIFFYRNGAWNKAGEAGNFDNFIVPTGAALVIRKKAGVESTVLWITPAAAE